MKLQIPTSVLRSGIARVADAVSQKSTLPILGNLLLEAENGVLTLTGTNLDQMAQVELSCNVEEPGLTTLPFRRVADIVGKVNGEDVSVSIDKKEVATITSGRATFTVSGLPATDFPGDLFPAKMETGSWKVDAGKLRHLLIQLSPLQSTDDTRHILQGVCFVASGPTITLVATNGKALSMTEVDNEGSDGSAILPADFIRQAVKALDAETEMTLSLSENSAKLTGKGFSLVSKLIEGNYPSYKQIVPTSCAGSVALPREEFLSLINRLATIGVDQSKECWVNIVGTKNSLDVSTNNAENTAHESLGVKLDVPFKARLNRTFIDAVLRNVVEDEVRLEYEDELRPFVFKAGNVTSVVMGARVK